MSENKRLPTRGEMSFMLLATGIYLTIEMAFAAHLLDVIGGKVDTEDLETIEYVGRVISGVALGLLLWSWKALPEVRKIALIVQDHGSLTWIRIKLLSFWMVAGLAIMWAFQWLLLEAITLSSTHDHRFKAASLVLFSESVKSGTAEISGFDLSYDTSPETKTFLAVFPALGMSLPDARDRIEPHLEDLLEAVIRSEMPSFEETKDAYVQTSDAMEKLYEAYRDLSGKHAEGMKELRKKQDSAWSRYRKSISRYNTRNMSESAKNRVRRDLNRNGVRVDRDWNINDKAGFYEAIERDNRFMIDSSFDGAWMYLAPFKVEPGLSRADFFGQKSLQEFWSSKMRLDRSILVRPGLSDADIEREIRDASVQASIENEIALYKGDGSIFEQKIYLKSRSIDLLHATWIPVIAIGFSLIGAMVHILKTLNFALKSMIPNHKRTSKIIMMAIVIIFGSNIVMMSFSENSISQHEIAQKLFASADENILPGFGSFILSLVNLQVFFWPIGNGIRETVLFDFQFFVEAEA